MHMASTTLLFAQAVPFPQASPSPTTHPGAGGGSGGGPLIDLGPLLKALSPENLFAGLLQVIGSQIEDAMTQILDALWHGGANVFTFTAPELTYAFPPIADLVMGMRILVAAVTVLASCSPRRRSPAARCLAGARTWAVIWVALDWR
jgi:hypothetical protein